METAYRLLVPLLDCGYGDGETILRLVEMADELCERKLVDYKTYGLVDAILDDNRDMESAWDFGFLYYMIAKEITYDLLRQIDEMTPERYPRVYMYTELLNHKRGISIKYERSKSVIYGKEWDCSFGIECLDGFMHDWMGHYHDGKKCLLGELDIEIENLYRKIKPHG